MRYFLFVSLSFFLLSCNKKIYQNSQEIQLSQSLTAADLKPKFEKELYRGVIDGKFGLKKFHFSGVLYMKNFGDTATRVVFQSEMGSTFFDFGWDHKDSFIVYSIMEQMNKPALIKTLKKDFEMLLVKNMAKQPKGIYNFDRNTRENYIKFDLEKGFVYYIADISRNIIAIENADESKKVVVMKMSPVAPFGQLADKISIKHLLAGFTIDLKKIKQDVAE